MNLYARLKEIEARMAEIREASSKEEDPERLGALETECDRLHEERKSIAAKLSIAGKTDPKPVADNDTKESRKEELEKRGTDLKEKRTVTVSSGEILLPQHTDGTLAPVPYKEVSTLVDRVRTVNLSGGETYVKSFVKSHGTAGLTGEGEPYSEAEPEFGYVTVTKVKVTAYTEITEELEKLPAVDYQAEVLRNVNVALRKKISEQILRGIGDSNAFTGIFSDKAAALADASPLEISEITETTLDDIVFAYGGDEGVEGGAVLVLNKNDLRAFAKLRTAEGRKVHAIDYVASTIDGIPYVINSNCRAVSDPATAEGEYCIAYGALENYEVPVFSPVEVMKSTDYKFRDGIVCYRASVFAGGNVVGYNGFLRVRKKAAASEAAASVASTTKTTTTATASK